jgi:transcriptional regulator with XRE-family HTH domain
MWLVSTREVPMVAREIGGDPVVVTFASAVRRARKARRWSQETLAELIGTDQTTISQLEMGKFRPKYQTVIALAEAFGFPPEPWVELAGYRVLGEGKDGAGRDQGGGDIFDRAPLARLLAELEALPTAPGQPTIAEQLRQADRMTPEKRARFQRRLARLFLFMLREELEREEEREGGDAPE